MEKPAIEGGIPVRETDISYGHQYIDEDDIRAVTEVMRSDFLTCGPKIAQLEETLCRLTGARRAVAVSSGTAALHAACLAIGLGPGDELITTPMTFAASANCALYCGAKPVFADIDETTYNIDPASVEEHITQRTKAVVAVDFTGQAADIDRLRAVCEAHGLILIEDAAHSIGTKYRGRPVGSLADLTTFSFHPVKTVTGGEGGAVLTDSDELYEKLLLARTHGITRKPERMSRIPDGPWYYEMESLGYNYRMTDMQAALVISQLGKLDRFAKRRKEITARYDAAFRKLPQLFVQRNIPESDTVRHLYLIRLVPERLSLDRAGFFRALGAEHIIANVHYIPVYYFPFYQKMGYQKGLCPKAEALYENILTLPLFYGMTDEDVDSVIHAVERICAYYAK